MSHIFGKIEGRVFGDFVRMDPSHNSALVELLLAQQARDTLNKVGCTIGLFDRDIVIFRGKDDDGEYMGWRTGGDGGTNVVNRLAV